MTLDLAAVMREAAARWRQDRALLLPIAGLLLFVPQWAVLLFVPEVPQGVADPSDAAAMAAWAAAAQRWMQAWGPLYLGAILVAQWGQLAVVALYVGGAASGTQRPTVAGALAMGARRLGRYLLATLVSSSPLAAAVLVGSAAPPLLIVLVPAALWLIGRLLLVGPAILARRDIGALAAVGHSWRWTRGNGAALALLAGALIVGASVLVRAVQALDGVLRGAHLGNPVVTAAIDGLAAAVASAAMLALAMSVGVLYRRLAR